MPTNGDRPEGRARAPRRNLKSISLLVCLLGVILSYVYSQQSVEGTGKTTVIRDLTFWPAKGTSIKDRSQVGKENATIYMLVRNFELQEALESMRELEDRFNKNYRYPWVFLNDEEFTDEFKTMTTGMASGQTFYGHIDPKIWNVPEHINRTKMSECIQDFTDRNIIYGDSISYRNMCRYNSGNFFKDPLLLNYDWYWRVEPGVHYFCDQRYDPFTFLRENNKVYGFVITLREYPETIPTLWKTTSEFFEANPEYVATENALDFATGSERLFADEVEVTMTDGYNLCHFWSNFEIGSLNFFRDEKYSKYFEHLDHSGGFYYERWGDAPVHTLGLLALANRSQIHHFSDIGYYHLPFHRCPHDDASYTTGRCLCPSNRGDEVDFKPFSCLPRWWHYGGREFLFNFNNERSNLEQ